MKVSIKKISQITGFSPATVSNALNRKKGVNPVTSEKILKAAETLGYQQGKTITKIKFVTYRKNGLIIDDSQIFPAMIEGVERQAKELGYETTFCHLNYEDESFEIRLKAVSYTHLDVYKRQGQHGYKGKKNHCPCGERFCIIYVGGRHIYDHETGYGKGGCCMSWCSQMI